MTPDKNQYLPNDYTVQMDYRSNPRVLDHRGHWAQSLSEHLELEKWVITENKFDVFDSPKTVHAYVAFNRCGMTCVDVERSEHFLNKAEKFLQFLFSLREFGNPLSVLRIGVKPRFCTPFNGGFDALLKRVRERYVDLKPDAYAAVGDSVELIDFGAPVNFRDEHGDFNTHCGPMARKQMKQMYFNYRAYA